jgi:dTDP-4-amino-4,6-dideoxygalactose transaminase
VYHLYVVRVAEREELQRRSGEQGIGTGMHYPIPLHLQNAYRGLGYRAGDFPVCEAAGEIVSLPMFPGLERAEQERVAEVVAGQLVG